MHDSRHDTLSSTKLSEGDKDSDQIWDARHHKHSTRNTRAKHFSAEFNSDVTYRNLNDSGDDMNFHFHL